MQIWEVSLNARPASQVFRKNNPCLSDPDLRNLHRSPPDPDCVLGTADDSPLLSTHTTAPLAKIYIVLFFTIHQPPSPVSISNSQSWTLMKFMAGFQSPESSQHFPGCSGTPSCHPCCVLLGASASLGHLLGMRALE